MSEEIFTAPSIPEVVINPSLQTQNEEAFRQELELQKSSVVNEIAKLGKELEEINALLATIGSPVQQHQPNGYAKRD